MVTNTQKHSKQQASVSFGMLCSAHGLLAMNALLIKQQLQHKAVIGAARLEYWHALLANAPQVPALYEELTNTSGLRSVSVLPSSPSRAGFPTAMAAEVTSASHSLDDRIRGAVTSVLGGPSVDPTLPLASQGLDSLAALELRQTIQVRCSENVSHDHSETQVACY